MIVLLKKDMLVLREVIWGLIIVTLGSLVLPICIAGISSLHEGRAFSRDDAAGVLYGSSGLGLMTLALMATAIGGSSFATERRERWVEFLAILPVTRAKIVLSKLILALGLIVITFAFWIAIEFLSTEILADRPIGSTRIASNIYIWGSTIAMLFACSWALSTFMRSATIAAGIAIGIVALLGLTFSTLILSHRTGPSADWIGYLAIDTFFAASICIVAVSSILYCRRVSP